MKATLIKLGIGIVLLIVGWKIAAHGDSIVSKEEIQELQHFCDHADITEGSIRDTYKEITVKIGKSRTKMYEFTYDFEVNGKSYTATKTTSQTTADDNADIWFDKTDPAKNDTSNPCTELERTKKEKTIGDSTYYYIGGVLMLLIGLGLASGSFKQLLRNLFSSKKK